MLHFLIAGDVLFKGSIGRTDLYMGNLEVLLSSIKEKIFSHWVIMFNSYVDMVSHLRLGRSGRPTRSYKICSVKENGKMDQKESKHLAVIFS